MGDKACAGLAARLCARFEPLCNFYDVYSWAGLHCYVSVICGWPAAFVNTVPLTSSNSVVFAQAFSRARATGVTRAAVCDITPPFLTAMPQQSYVCAEAAAPHTTGVFFATSPAPSLVAELATSYPGPDEEFGIGIQQSLEAAKAMQGVPDKDEARGQDIEFTTPPDDQEVFKVVYEGDEERPTAP